MYICKNLFFYSFIYFLFHYFIQVIFIFLDGLEKDIVFSGKEFLHFTGLPTEKNHPAADSQSPASRFSFQFRSRQANGFMAYLKQGAKFSTEVFLSDDCVVVTLAVFGEPGDHKIHRSPPCRDGPEVVVFRDFSLHNLSLEIKKDTLEV